MSPTQEWKRLAWSTLAPNERARRNPLKGGRESAPLRVAGFSSTVGDLLSKTGLFETDLRFFDL